MAKILINLVQKKIGEIRESIITTSLHVHHLVVNDGQAIWAFLRRAKHPRYCFYCFNPQSIHFL